MANEAETGKIIIVDTSFPEDISWVYKDQTFSDIILHCNGEKIHAHKVILATRCPYFQSVLVENPKMSEFTINDVSVEIFKKIIQYIYTGSLGLVSSDTPLILEVMRLASRFSLKNLELKISEEISFILDSENVLDMFNEAVMHNMEGLKTKCYSFIDERPLEILENDSIKNLSQKSMVSLLERDSLCVFEIDIFKSVQKWCQVNKDTNNLVVNCVRLNLLTNDEIVKIVFPSKLIENQKLLEVLAQSVDGKQKLSNSRNAFIIENENLASAEHGAQVISGQNTAWLLCNNNTQFAFTQSAFHLFSDRNGITIKLKKPIWANHIEIALPALWKMMFYSYYIEASQDQKTWQTIIDYSRYSCNHLQYLYFDKISAQYFRIVGTPSRQSVVDRFELVSFKLYWKSNTPNVKDGIVCPKDNIRDSGSVLIKPVDGAWMYLTSFGPVFISDHFIIHLGQPYWISNIKIRRKNNCRYNIQTSLDQVNWESVGDKCQEDPSWQKFVFEERCVIYIKSSFCQIPSEFVRFNMYDFEISSNS